VTHNELLDKINILGHTSSWAALRAVVELHSPISSYMFNDNVCEHCSVIDDNTEMIYPCPTIQAIEKELS